MTVFDSKKNKNIFGDLNQEEGEKFDAVMSFPIPEEWNKEQSKQMQINTQWNIISIVFLGFHSFTNVYFNAFDGSLCIFQIFTFLFWLYLVMIMIFQDRTMVTH